MANQYSRKEDIEYIKCDLIVKGGRQDVTRLLVKGVFYEDLFSNAITFELTLHDSENLPEINPIVGDEFLDIQFKSTKKPKNYDYPIISLYMKLMAIESKVVKEGSTKQYYTLTFISLTGYKNLTKRMNRAYNLVESEIASNVLQKVLEVSNFEIESTKWPRRMVVPNWTPFELLNYLAKGSVRASGYPASNFLFWEDRDKHYFKSLDKIMEQPNDVILENVITGHLEWDRSDNFTQMNVSEFHAQNTFNDTLNTQNGLWASRFIGHDIIKKKLTAHDWLYSSEWNSSVQIDGANERLRSDYPNNTWISESFGPWQENDPDYNGWKSEDYMKRRGPMLQQFQNYQFNCVILGDNNIRVGQKVQFNLPSHSHRERGKEDELLKGSWVITRIRHELSQREHIMILELRKPQLKSFGPQKVIPNQGEA